MNKEEFLKLVNEKGTFKINGIEIVTSIGKSLNEDYLNITHKAINPYTVDNEFNGGWIKYIKDEDIQELDNAVLKSYNKMIEQEKICKKEPLVLEKNGEYYYDNKNNEYKMEQLKDHFEIIKMSNGEADYSINKPIKIDEKVYFPVWSWWLDKGCYGIK